MILPVLQYTTLIAPLGDLHETRDYNYKGADKISFGKGGLNTDIR